jgi:hypothetical protein
MNKEHLTNLLVAGKFKELFAILATDSELNGYIVLLSGRYTKNERDSSLNLICRDDYTLELSRIRAAAMDYIDMYSGNVPTSTPIKATESTVMIQLKSLTQDSKLQRLHKNLYQKAVDLYKQFQEYNEKKDAPNSIYDSSGRIKDMLNVAYKSLLESIENAGKDGKESMEILVNKKLSEGVPSWDVIQEVYDVAVGRNYSNNFIERNLKSRVNDDFAKVEAADLLINWAKHYLK